MKKREFTISEIKQMFTIELNRALTNKVNRIGNTSNNNAVIHKCKFMLHMLSRLNDSDILKVGKCRGDGLIRNFSLTNAGDVVEGIVNLIADKSNGSYYERKDAGMIDLKVGLMDYEIKASTESHFLCTKVQLDKPVLLVNRSGVSVIKKSDLPNLIDPKKGTLPATGVFGSRLHPLVRQLEKALDIVGGFIEK